MTTGSQGQALASDQASRYAQGLLAALGTPAQREIVADDTHPAISWARSGLMQLTGHADGPPLMCPAPLASCANGALAALASLVPAHSLDALSGAALLAERGAIAGHERKGRVSPGGSCRLYRTSDGEIALNLSREEIGRAHV